MIITILLVMRYMNWGVLRNDDLVFSRSDGCPVCPNIITQAWSDLARKCGISASRLHDARHTHASIMLKAGVHPRIVHSTISIALDRYSHVVPGLQEAAAKRFDEAPPLGHNITVDK